MAASLKDDVLLDRVREIIEEVEAAEDLREVSDIRKMSGTTDFYRVRIGEWRIGVEVTGDTVDFVRC